jgi:hypothetical protein
MKQKPASHFGRLEFDAEQAGADGVSFQPGRWQPNRRSLPKMPPNFCVTFQIIRVEGQRSILPTGIVELAKNAFYGGMRLLAAQAGLTREQRQSYRAMNLLFSWTLSPRRMHARSIERLQDLVLTRQDKRLLGEESLLPSDLTITRNGDCRQMTPKELVASGYEFATDEGIANVPFARAVELGLLSCSLYSAETARIRPKDSESFLRLALFGTDAGKRLDDPSLLSLVEENLISLLDGHLDDEDGEFDKWWDDLSGLCRALSRRTCMKPVSTDQVRYALYDLLLRSHRYAAQCIETQMRHVFHLMRPKLTAAELRYSKPWYERTKWLDHCSPIVFHSRIKLLAPVLSLLAESPDREILWPACLQALVWRTQILLARRELDERKQKAPMTEFQITDENWRTHENKKSGQRRRNKKQTDDD